MTIGSILLYNSTIRRFLSYSSTIVRLKGEFDMKNYIKFLGIILMAAIFALAFTACPLGPEPVPPEPEHVHQWGAWTQTTAAT
jgi:hypothetical protein